MTIDTSLTEEQELIQNSARDFFARECPVAVVRRAEAAAEDFPREIWRKMAELGWLGMGFSAEYGGAGCSVLDLLPLYTELGRHIAPVPLLDAVGLAGALIDAAGSAEQKKRLLPGIASGELLAVCAHMEPEGVYGPRGITLSAQLRGGDYLLAGTKLLVPCAASADIIAVAARTGGAKEPEGISLLLVDPKAKGVSIERTKTITGEKLYAVTFNETAVSASNLLGASGKGWPVLDHALMRASILQSAAVVGAGERVLDMTADYAKNRVQFGKAIGSYQAVQYLVTDIVIAVHLARVLNIQAAWRHASGRPWLREAALGKAAACKAAVAMIQGSHETHAGIGFMLDYDLQLYTRRAKHWEWNLGDRHYHLERSLVEAGI